MDVEEIQTKNSIIFLNIALGSSSETEYLIILCQDLNLIDETISIQLLEKINHIKSKINLALRKLIA